MMCGTACEAYGVKRQLPPDRVTQAPASKPTTIHRRHWSPTSSAVPGASSIDSVQPRHLRTAVRYSAAGHSTKLSAAVAPQRRRPALPDHRRAAQGGPKPGIPAVPEAADLSVPATLPSSAAGLFRQLFHTNSSAVIASVSCLNP